jgi:hypothetical protein
MNIVRFQMVFLIAVLISFVLALGAALGGCAPLTFKEYHGVLRIDGPSRVVGGPIHGHWAEEDAVHGVIVYTVRGADCADAKAQLDRPTIQDSGRFDLGPDTSLCMLPLVEGKTQYVQLHARRP